jgi:SAM-dependent methyltransferase
MDNPKQATQDLAATYAKQGKPNGWFEEFYARAGGDINKIYWADLKVNPLLVNWVEQHPLSTQKKAIIIGCGLGDDAEFLALAGYKVIAFDISASAIKMCKQRYPQSQVSYIVADLFNYPDTWIRDFDLVSECNTIQIIKGSARQKAQGAIADLAAKAGNVLVSCRCRNKGEDLESFPLALDREEIDGFKDAGLAEMNFLSYDDEQSPPVPHFFACYRRNI